MHIAPDRGTLKNRIQDWKRAGRSIAFVPTMGNLHEGHIALVARARTLADRVVASVYVNPTQFGKGEDLDAYPRTPEADIEALEQAGCDLLFIPAVDSIYPYGPESAFMLQAPERLASILEGAFRPGHFDGVVTVVSRLFNLVQPDIAVFGEKDFQQLQVIRRMVEDLGYDIAIEGVATVRDEEGLALSSRNRYLDAGQIEAARNLSRTLRDLATRIGEGEADYHRLEKEAVERLAGFGLRADYVSVRREQDLDSPRTGDKRLRVLAAAWCGPTRLIDNLSAHIACNHAD